MNSKHRISALTALGLGAGLLLVTADSAAAQTAGATRARATVAAPKNITIRGNSQRNVSMDIRNAPVKDAIQQLFLKAGVDYILDPDVRGTVTIRATNIPFETAVRLLAQSSDVPIRLYRNEVGVYEIRTSPTRYTASRNYQSSAPAATAPVSYVDPTSIYNDIPPENAQTGMPTAGLPTGLGVGYPGGFAGNGYGAPGYGAFPGFTGGFGGFGGFSPSVQYAPTVQYPTYPVANYPVYTTSYPNGGGWTTFGYPNGFFFF